MSPSLDSGVKEAKLKGSVSKCQVMIRQEDDAWAINKKSKMFVHFGYLPGKVSGITTLGPVSFHFPFF